MDSGQGDFSLFLLVDGLCARVDVVGREGRRAHGRVLEGPAGGLGAALAMLLEGSPPVGSRSALLTDRLWTGVLRLPLEDPQALGIRGLRRSLALAAEDHTGLTPDAAAVGFDELVSPDRRVRYWATIADRRLLEGAGRVLRAEGSELLWIAHPAGVLRESSGLRVEAWSDLTWCGGDGAPVHIVDGPPGEGHWALAVGDWIEKLRGSAPLFVGEQSHRDLLSKSGLLPRRSLLPQRRALELLHGVAARLAACPPGHAVPVDAESQVRAREPRAPANATVHAQENYNFRARAEPESMPPAAEPVVAAAIVMGDAPAAPLGNQVEAPTTSAAQTPPSPNTAAPAAKTPPAPRESAPPAPAPVAAAVRTAEPASAAGAGAALGSQPTKVAEQVDSPHGTPRRDPSTAKPAPYPELPKRVSGAPWLVPAAMAAAVVGGIFWHQHRATSSLAAAKVAEVAASDGQRAGTMPEGSLPDAAIDAGSSAAAADRARAARNDDGFVAGMQGDDPARSLTHENHVQRRRLPALLAALGRHAHEDFVVRRVAAKFGGAIAIEGVSDNAHAANQLADALAGELSRAGWSVAPADQRRRAFPTGRDGYDFVIELTPVAVPRDALPLGGAATLPNISSRSSIVERLNEALASEGATITASSPDEGAIARSSEELVALAQMLVSLGEKPVGWRIDMRTSFPVLTRRLQALAEEPDFLLPAALELDQSGEQGEIEVKLWLWI
ncbi:MAG: hypothetical protein GC161_04600 [Planctomycetaceae bacterium]|nr:hypothetical protein [Planctomycetaceae bacterium]